MPGSTSLQLYQYPVSTDQASPAGLQTIAQAIERQVVAVFPDTGTRDSRWTAATGLANGAMCFISATGELQLRAGGAWVVIGGRASAFAMATAQVGFSINNATNITVAVTFPAGRFSATPRVLQIGSSAGANTHPLTYRNFNVTTTGCDINIAHNDLALVTVTTESFTWFALQMTSAAGNG
jgi:hypothetical protein